MTILTDHKGESIATVDEPNPGSVLLTNGQTGTAWQRFMSDGKWHPTRGGGSRTWAELLTHRNVILIYVAAPRPSTKAEQRRMAKAGAR